jgi:predicted nuclease of predicted toxin-antitoxin system
MKFLIDAQLPQKFVGWLQEQGHDAIHTLDLPRKNATPDSKIEENISIPTNFALGSLRKICRKQFRVNGANVA